MTDRVKGLYVVLDNDYRDDDVQEIINAIKMIKGVQDVTNSIVDGDDWMNRSRIGFEFQSKILDVLKDLK